MEEEKKEEKLNIGISEEPGEESLQMRPRLAMSAPFSSQPQPTIRSQQARQDH